MKPKSFPEVNQIYAKDQPEYNPLPVFKDEKGTVVSCWELTDDEIEKIKADKCIWLSVMTFNQPLQPLFMTADKEDILTPIEREESDFEECIGCGKKWNIEEMMQDDADENYCQDCWEELSPIIKAEYDELVKNGEIEPND